MPATASDRPAAARGPHRLRWSARLRLTILYGGLFLLSGAALLTITYLLVATRGEPKIVVKAIVPGNELRAAEPDLLQQAKNAQDQYDESMRQLLTQSATALALMSATSVATGWLVAGRVLRPVRTMADRARSISDRNLHERLDVTGPNDEFKELGDTFDELLGRLDAAFDAQRRFAANASHELRTPLTLQRAMIEVALANPTASTESLRAVCERVLAAGEHQEHLIDGLLTLTRSHRGLERREPTDLAPVVRATLHDRHTGPVRVEHDLAPAWTVGDPRLVERLVSNLLDNALRHNAPDGWVRVTTRVADGGALLRVANSGPHIPHDRIDALFQPFQRNDPRTGSPDGHGLGLSIVAAVATAHDADVTALPGPEGGLDITVAFPAAAPHAV